MPYELLLKNARVVDPQHGIDGPRDVAVEAGRIAAIGDDLDPDSAERTWDLSGMVVGPGLVDVHVHTTLGPGGRGALAMLPRAGVTTAVDLGGPPGRVLDLMARYGSGITLASLQVLRPNPGGEQDAFSSGPESVLPTTDPDAAHIRAAIERGVREGALGTKILGGHFPFTPEATVRIIEQSRERGAYIAFHVGTTTTGSNLEGLQEAMAMASPRRRVHLCHINSALRGQVLASRQEEAARAMAALEAAADAVISESFLTRWSPDPGLCIHGAPESAVVRTSLGLGGYEATQEGLAHAIDDGFAVVIVPRGDSNVAVSGAAAVRYWRETGTRASIAFPISYADSGLICATHKRRDGAFTVTALASDSGMFPFNVTLEHGLMLVEFGALTLLELIHKAARAPARMLGLQNKGHLGEGADADLIVIDLAHRRVRHTLVGGELVMTDGLVVGRGGTFLTTSAGVNAAAARGLRVQVVDLSNSLLYRDPHLR